MPPQPTHASSASTCGIFLLSGVVTDAFRGWKRRSCARLARFRHLKYWIRDVFRAGMSNPASSTVYLLQSTMLLYTRARRHARTHARGNMSETPTLLTDSSVLLHGARVAFCSPLRLLQRATHAGAQMLFGGNFWRICASFLLWKCVKRVSACKIIESLSRMRSLMSVWKPVGASVIKNNNLPDFFFVMFFFPFDQHFYSLRAFIFFFSNRDTMCQNKFPPSDSMFLLSRYFETASQI